jgi:hypothetical protein
MQGCQPEYSLRFSPSAAILFCVLAAASCGAAAAPNGGEVEVTVRAQTVTNAISVRLTVQSSSAHSTTLRLALMAKDKQYASVIHDLPVADDYAFTSEARDQSSNVFARGTATKVAINMGVTARVII